MLAGVVGILCFGSIGVELSASEVAVAQTIDSRKVEADRLLKQASKQYNSNQHEAAKQSAQKALLIYQAVRNRDGEAWALNYLGLAYYSLSEYDNAINFYEKSLVLFRELQQRNGEAQTLSGLAQVYSMKADYAKAIKLYQQALPTFRAIKDQNQEAWTLLNLGNTYLSLANYEQAVSQYQQALPIFQALRNFDGEAYALKNLGLISLYRSQYEKAVAYYQKALVLFQKVKDYNGEAYTLSEIGQAYSSLSQYTKATRFYEQAVPIFRQIGDRNGEANSLMNWGNNYRFQSQYNQAMLLYQKALSIFQTVGNLDDEGYVLSYIAKSFKEQNQPELAIVFYKQSVNVREKIREKIRQLARKSQESYTESIAGSYRELADLLIAQGRVLEAQQVLELLKIQELRDYTRDTRAGGPTQGAPLNPIEAPVLPPFDRLIALGLKLTTCEAQKPFCVDRDQLRSQRDQATEQFRQQADRLRTLARQGRDKDPAQLQQEELTVAAYKVVQAQPHTVLIYPLVLDDKLWLVYGLQAGKQGVAFASKEIPVTRKELASTVTRFRQLLENPNSDRKELEETGQKLYGWLVEPLRSQLDANNIQNLVFSLDRSTRYIPIAALHDGKQYLAQRFSLSTILTAGLTDTQDKLSSNLADNAVLGLGLSNATPGFPALPNVVNELNTIVRTTKPSSQGIFQGTERLNGDFTLTAFKDILDYRILHLATHGKFNSEDPEQSFLVLGDGSHFKVTDIKKMNDLAGIHLVVLSACETAQGGPDKEGIEVSGLSYYFLTQNVKSVIASLWKVNDASTSQLMQQFYKNLATGKMSKAEALRQAQITLIQGNGTGTDGKRGGNFTIKVMVDGKTSTINRSLSHPFYWAPFILIGNGL